MHCAVYTCAKLNIIFDQPLITGPTLVIANYWTAYRLFSLITWHIHWASLEVSQICTGASTRGPQRKKSRTPCLEINGNQQKFIEINQEITRNHLTKSLAFAGSPTVTYWLPEAGLMVWYCEWIDGVSRVAKWRMFGCFVLSISYFWHCHVMSCMFTLSFKSLYTQ